MSYSCHCHKGKCPLHEESNSGRDKFTYVLCRELGFNPDHEAHGSSRHNLARRILRASDTYVNEILLTRNIDY